LIHPGSLITGILPENPGVLSMKAIAEIRRRHKINGESIRSLAREFGHSRNTIRKHLDSVEEPFYQRTHQPAPALGDYTDLLTTWLEHDIKLPRKQRRTTQRLFECLQAEGYVGSYSPIQRFVKARTFAN
jgi:transposase